MNIRIRQEESTELPAICKLIEAAFADMQESDHQEHHLVEKLHRRYSRIYFVDKSGNRFRK